MGVDGVNSNQCKNLYPNLDDSNQVCAGGEYGEDSCEGDSGKLIENYSKSY